MDIEKLQGLADKLARTKGPDRELDKEIGYLLLSQDRQCAGDYTSSIDAALEVAEALGYHIASIEWNASWSGARTAEATIIEDEGEEESWGEEAANPSLAILSALTSALIIKVVRDLKRKLSADDRAIVESAEEYDAIFSVVGGKWFVDTVDGQFENCVEAARAYCQFYDIPLPDGSGPSMR